MTMSSVTAMGDRMGEHTPPSVVVLDDNWPTNRDVREVLDAIVDELRRDPDAMIDAVLGGMYRHVPTYASLPADQATVVRRGVAHTVTTFIGLLVDARRLSPEELEAIAAIGAVRASQGVPLDDMLRAIRVAMRFGWGHILDRAAAYPPGAPTTAALGRLAAEIFDYMQQSSAAMTRGVEEHLRTAGEQHSRAVDRFVEELLSGAFDDDRDAALRAAEVDIDVAAPWVVVLVTSAQLDDDRIPMLRRLPDELTAEVASAMHGALRATPTTHAVALVAAADAATVVERAAVRADKAGALVLVSPPARGAVGVRIAYREAVGTIAAARRIGAPAGVVDARRFASHRLLSGTDRDAARECVTDVLGPLLEAGAGRRTRLLEVLDASVATDGTPAAVAERLSISTKTVVARIREIERLTGLRLENTDDRLLLQVAAMLRRLHGDETDGT